MPDIDLPRPPFLYTLDQVASILNVSVHELKTRHVYFWGVTHGLYRADELLARTITRNGEPPDWRISEAELMRWLKRMGFSVYRRQRRLV